LRKRLHKNFLGRLFNETALPEKSTGKTKYARAVPADDFSKRILVTGVCKFRQLQIRTLFVVALFVIYCQKRSSNGIGLPAFASD
jgi:hypothetical protein